MPRSFDAEHGVDHFPRSALAGAAGNADDRARELSPPPAGPIVQRPMRIVDADDPASSKSLSLGEG